MSKGVLTVSRGIETVSKSTRRWARVLDGEQDYVDVVVDSEQTRYNGEQEVRGGERDLLSVRDTMKILGMTWLRGLSTLPGAVSSMYATVTKRFLDWVRRWQAILRRLFSAEFGDDDGDMYYVAIAQLLAKLWAIPGECSRTRETVTWLVTNCGKRWLGVGNGDQGSKGNDEQP